MKVHLGPDHGCAIYDFWKEWLQSSNQAAVLELDGRDPVKYYNATAANRYRFALRSGYTAVVLSWLERDEFLADIYDINTSMERRQGRPMKENYLDRPGSTSSVVQSCEDHYTKFIACFKDSKVIAYISANFCGDLAAASQILGHGGHLKNGCMLVLWAEFVRLCQQKISRVIVYSRWSDGTDGLRYWKHSVGMKPVILKQQV